MLVEACFCRNCILFNPATAYLIFNQGFRLYQSFPTRVKFKNVGEERSWMATQYLEKVPTQSENLILYLGREFYLIYP